MAARKKTVDFEKSLDELEELVEALEEGELPLEQALQTFERGIKLTQECQKALADAEQKVEQLLKTEGGTQTLPFDEPED